MRRPLIVDRSQDAHFMREALALAAEGAALGEVPVGAVLVQGGVIVGRGFNARFPPVTRVRMPKWWRFALPRAGRG